MRKEFFSNKNQNTLSKEFFDTLFSVSHLICMHFFLFQHFFVLLFLFSTYWILKFDWKIKIFRLHFKIIHRHLKCVISEFFSVLCCFWCQRKTPLAISRHKNKEFIWEWIIQLINQWLCLIIWYRHAGRRLTNFQFIEIVFEFISLFSHLKNPKDIFKK